MEVVTGYGLHKHPTFNELINYIQEGPTSIKYPNRNASWAYDNPFLTQLDDDWQDETIAPGHAQLRHQLWMAEVKARNPAAIYNPATGTTAEIGDLEPSELSVRALDDLTERSLAATTFVQLTDAGTTASIPGIEIRDGMEIAVAAETGRSWLPWKRIRTLPPINQPELRDFTAPEASSFTLIPPKSKPVSATSASGSSGASNSGLVRAAGTAASAAGTAASAAVTAAGAVGSTVSTAIAVGGHIAATAAPMVDALGGAVGTGLQGLDTLGQAILTPIIDDIRERAREEAHGMMRELMGLGQAGKRAPFEGTLLPVQVLNGEQAGDR